MIVEERVSYLETKMEECGLAIIDIRSALIRLDDKMDRRFDRVESRFYWVIGIQFTILLSVIAGLFGVVTKLL
jgi:hypothetical protein